MLLCKSVFSCLNIFLVFMALLAAHALTTIHPPKPTTSPAVFIGADMYEVLHRLYGCCLLPFCHSLNTPFHEPPLCIATVFMPSIVLPAHVQLFPLHKVRFQCIVFMCEASFYKHVIETTLFGMCKESRLAKLKCSNEQFVSEYNHNSQS